MAKLTVTEVDGKVELSDIKFTVDGECFSVALLFWAFRARGKEIASLERQLAEARKQAFEEVYHRQKGIYENHEMSSTMVASEMLFAVEALRREAEKQRPEESTED